MFVTIIGIIILVLVGLTEFSTFRTGVPTVASFRPSRRAMIEILKKNFGTTPVSIVDLGSGNGQLASQIACALPEATITGFEISIVPFLISTLRRKLFGPKNLSFRRIDFWTFDCSGTDAFVLYLTGPVIEKISHKLRKELKPGALVLVNEIPLQGDWQPIGILPTGFLTMKIYVYRQDL